MECATLRVPRDYGNPRGAAFDLPVIRLRARDESRRIGSLLLNPGGPGGSGVDFLRAAADIFTELNQRYDLVSWDPRGVGGSSGAVNCGVDPEQGPYGFPAPRPPEAGDNEEAYVERVRAYVRQCVERNRTVLPYISTLSTVYDLDRLRAAVGDRRLSYLGFSYGTQIGAVYATTFPNRYRALVLDGAVDVEGALNRPIEALREQTAGFEQGLNRFFIACAANQEACLGFGGDDPGIAYDELLERLDASPIPAPEASRPLPVDGDVARNATLLALYAKQLWPILAQALAGGEAGDGSLLRELSDALLGINPDGTYSPGIDQYFMITALEAREEGGVETYVRAGRHGYALFPHFWFNTGYSQLVDLFLTVRPAERFRGPVRARASAPTTLVVGTTYDTATPYIWAQRLTRDLGNARLLTMRGDGHTAYGGNSACIDASVDAYLLEGTLPAPGTVCRQEVPFAQAAPEVVAQSAGRAVRRIAPGVTPLAAR